MARLNEIVDSEEEFPDLSTILQCIPQSPLKVSGRTMQKEQGSRRSSHSEDDQEHLETQPLREAVFKIPQSVSKTSCADKNARKQRPLKLAQANSFLLSIMEEAAQKSKHRDYSIGSKQDEFRRPTKRTAARIPKKRNTFAWSPDGTSSPEDEWFSDGLSDFVVDSSDSDIQSTPPTSKANFRIPESDITPGERGSRTVSPSKIVDLTSPRKHSSAVPFGCLPSKAKYSDAYNPTLDDEPNPYMGFSPPRSKSPKKTTYADRPATPPPNPSKGRLQSPSKKSRIPPSPHRPSVDAFWSQEIINDWNDRHSPRKTTTLNSSRGAITISDAEKPKPEPFRSPKIVFTMSPIKKDKEEAQRRKIFNTKKQELAISFLKELDEQITNGHIAALAASAGGIHIIWSKKLSSTAGRANWRREALRSISADGSTFIIYRHHASIELADKIIDDEDRLFNVIAHEYCHLANFMISGVKNNPHGKEFKQWAHKVTLAFTHLSIHVTTKHTYTITYRYIWTCTACSQDYKRHSRSIDPTRHSCSKCTGKLVQVQPVPRPGKGKAVKAGLGGVGGAQPKEGAKESGPGTTPTYQEYIKRHFGRIRAENPGAGMACWMTVLGRAFRDERDASTREGQAAALFWGKGRASESASLIPQHVEGVGESEALDDLRGGKTVPCEERVSVEGTEGPGVEMQRLTLGF